MEGDGEPHSCYGCGDEVDRPVPTFQCTLCHNWWCGSCIVEHPRERLGPRCGAESSPPLRLDEDGDIADMRPDARDRDACVRVQGIFLAQLHERLRRLGVKDPELIGDGNLSQVMKHPSLHLTPRTRRYFTAVNEIGNWGKHRFWEPHSEAIQQYSKDLIYCKCGNCTRRADVWQATLPQRAFWKCPAVYPVMEVPVQRPWGDQVDEWILVNASRS